MAREYFRAGTSGPDRLEGVDRPNHLQGLAGDDDLFGRDLADLLEGDSGNDHLYGNGGDDWLVGDEGEDELRGGPGNDKLQGGDDDDRLFGENGNDDLRGGSGNNELFGGSGSDLLYGDDRFEFSIALGADDLFDGGGGIDTVSYVFWDGGVQVDLQRGRGSGAGNDRFIGIENVQGSSGDDILRGDGGNNRLNGSAGDDRLIGGAGNDKLEGFSGRDVLTGGPGRDSFAFYTYMGSGITEGTTDVILDWSVEDRIIVPVSGDATNYREVATTAATIQDAAMFAESAFPQPEVRYAFLYNEASDTGFMLIDNDNNHVFETGIILRGAGSSSDMSSLNLVADFT